MKINISQQFFTASDQGVSRRDEDENVDEVRQFPDNAHWHHGSGKDHDDVDVLVLF